MITKDNFQAYHVTWEDSLPGIMREGLRTDLPTDDDVGSHGAVFVADAGQAESMVSQMTSDDPDDPFPAVLLVTFPNGVELHPDDHMPGGTSWYTEDSIPAEWLEIVIDKPLPILNRIPSTVEEDLIIAQLPEGKRAFAVRPGTFTMDSVTSLMESCPNATLLLVKPPYLIIEADDLDPSIGTPIEDFSELVGEVEDGVEDVSDGSASEASGQGYEITPDDWANVLLLCNGQATDISDVDISWLIETGLAERAQGTRVRPTALALNWTKQNN